MLHIAGWDDDPLSPGKADDPACVEEPFDLLVDAADCLDLAALIDRTGNRVALPDRRLRQRREQREQLGGRGAVAVHPAIGLFEDEADVERQRPVSAETAA